MDPLFGDSPEPEDEPLPAFELPWDGPEELSVYDPSFSARVAAFLRFSPVVEMAEGARRRDWPADTYDIVTLALTAIDMVVARQGLELEATREDVLGALRELAARAAPGRSSEEHGQVAAFVVDSLLNRGARQSDFRYATSDYAGVEGHRRRAVTFSLLVEHDDPRRDENVLRATPDAVNALIGGLDFDVEDEQVATELVLERQLARNAFESARKSAERARLLSVRLADDLDRVIKQTRRDLRSVETEWDSLIPDRLESARDHIRERLNAERRLLRKVGEALESAEPKILAAAVRIDRLLRECRRRHEDLHRRVITTRGVFLDEQERQSFRPPAVITLPDPQRQVLEPLLELRRTDALTLTQRFLVDMWGPRVPRLPRLYRLINDLWDRPGRDGGARPDTEETEFAEPRPPLIGPLVVEAAARAVESVGLPARLSTLIDACLRDTVPPSPALRRRAAQVLALAVLWAYSPEDLDMEEVMTDDLMWRVLGPRTAVGADGTRLSLPGWDGDDVIVAPDADALATAAPVPTIAFTHVPEDAA
ncbi:hypothetical protein ABZ801_04855 [Actinomadura sp. NPDC047616]|uniref:hypothetical protein n=1 Tax=Actinomadura sp. NPDC047616 TaxID=3155914 RepID=UPI0033FEDC70